MDKKKMIKIGAAVVGGLVIAFAGYKVYQNWQAKKEAAKVGGGLPPAPDANSSSPAPVASPLKTDAPDASPVVLAGLPATQTAAVNALSDLETAVAFAHGVAESTKNSPYWDKQIVAKMASASQSRVKSTVDVLYAFWVTNKNIPASVTQAALKAAVVK